MFVLSLFPKRWHRLILRLIYCWRAADQSGMMGSMMQDLAFAIPGVDEAMSFAEIMKYEWFPFILPEVYC